MQQCSLREAKNSSGRQEIPHIYHAQYSLTYHIISYHLFSFCRSVEAYKIHMDMEIVTFLGIKK